MTTLHRIVQTGLAVGSLLLASQLANIAQAAGACAVKDELSLALHPARWSEREPHEFDDVKLVAGSFERTHIVGDVFEYAILLKVGPDDHDRIRLHRVVREKAPCKPRPKHKAVFLLHGGTVDFRVSFLPSLLSSHAPHDQSFAVFLAQRNIDVWGLTMRSLLIPIDTTDFTFMQDWNYETDIHDIAISLGIARRVRALTGSGFGKMHLIGWSNGGTLTYAYANDETRFPPRRRHVKGLVPIDTVFKFSPEDEAQRQDACTRTAAIQLRLDAGLFQIIDGRETRQAGFLAETDPDGPYPSAPQFTNRTAVLLGAAASRAVLFFPDFPPLWPFYHYHAGHFDLVSGLPTDLTFTRAAYLFNLYQEFPPFWVQREYFEFNALPCNELDLPYDDHLRKVKAPVLYVGARGGFGEYGDYSTTLLGSRDVTTLNVTLTPEQALDFGHSDLFWADNASTVAWEPIYKWVRTH